MDPETFDGLIRKMAGARSRRALVGGSLGAAVLGAAGLGGEALARKGKKGKRVTAQGPCGDGGGKANACTKHKACCTGYCDKQLDRCRCKKLGDSCTEDRNCCARSGQPMTCQNGACQMVQAVPAPLSPPPPPPPPPPLPPPPPTFCEQLGKDLCHSTFFEEAVCSSGDPFGCVCMLTANGTRFCADADFGSRRAAQTCAECTGSGEVCVQFAQPDSTACDGSPFECVRPCPTPRAVVP